MNAFSANPSMVTFTVIFHYIQNSLMPNLISLDSYALCKNKEDNSDTGLAERIWKQGSPKCPFNICERKVIRSAQKQIELLDMTTHAAFLLSVKGQCLSFIISLDAEHRATLKYLVISHLQMQVALVM